MLRSPLHDRVLSLSLAPLPSINHKRLINRRQFNSVGDGLHQDAQFALRAYPDRHQGPIDLRLSSGEFLAANDPGREISELGRLIGEGAALVCADERTDRFNKAWRKV